MPKSHNDPHAKREAKKYDKPIPSREFLLDLLAELGTPMTHEKLVKKLKLTDEDQIEALRRRLRAMQRDGQLMCNRRGSYGLVSKMNLIAGTVSAHKDGFGFLMADKGGDDLFLNARQMRQVMHGDRVLVSPTGQGWKGRKEAQIMEVIERNTEFVVGRYFEEGGMGFVEPNNKQLTQDIAVPQKFNLDATSGQIVSVKITSQPTAVRQPVGEVVEVLGEHMAPGMEIDMAVRTYNIPHHWSEDVLKEVEQWSDEVPKEAMKGRKDLRKLALVTIDGEDAKDFDDAVYCERRTLGGWRLYVAIADVSYYVQDGTALDVEAKDRGTSVYFPGRVVPMLPEKLSNGLCSLNPNVDRLCMVCEMSISSSGKITRNRFYSAVMQSKRRLTYTNVDKILRGDGKLRKQFAEFIPHLENLEALYKVLRQTREKRGALEFNTRETKIIFSNNKKIERIVPTERNEAHCLIEECMLAANVSAANFAIKEKLHVLYRNHEGPAETKLKDLRDFLGEFGLKLGGGKKPKPKDYAVVLKAIQGREDFDLIQTVMLRSLSQAVYTPENGGHFGLGYDAYTHFTSPIRRYPDLLLHRGIKSVVDKKNGVTIDAAQVQALGEHCSRNERRADEATRDVTDWLKCEFMQEKLGQQFSGKITGVTSFGVFVALDDIFAEGLVHITSLKDDYYDFHPAKHALYGQRTGQRYRLGDKINILVARVDLDKRQIDFELVG
tara:strand:- start:41086 stop:43245 length:2160 start_codon:yes stop_codon:yes gene_type:complete